MPILDGGILQVAGLHCEQCTHYWKQINTLFAVESRSSFVSNWPGVSLYSLHRTIQQFLLFIYVYSRKGLPSFMTRRIALFSLVLYVLLLSSCSSQPSTPGNSAAPATAQIAHPTIVFMTDFGAANDAVAICKAVIVGIAPDARIMDITHQVTPFSIEEGARFLAGVSPYYPAGTVFLTVIDPGVGTSRKAVIVKTKKGTYFVVPDNGLVSLVVDRDGLDSAREITNPQWMIGDAVSSTFHGRDIFSPAGAHLASGWDYTMAGPEVQQLVRLTPKTAVVTEKGIEG